MKFPEAFLHYIWQYQKFHKSDLKTADGSSISIIEKGFLNTNAGPDFLEAKIEIDGVLWAGAVEIHIKSGDWQQHKHQNNEAYNQVILHVVFENDKAIFRADHTPIPTLALNRIIEQHALNQYHRFLASSDPIPCHGFNKDLNAITKYSAVERALAERLNKKAKVFLELAHEHDSETAAYQLLMRYAGGHVNRDRFQELSRIIPFNILKKDLKSVKEFLFYMAGFDENPEGKFLAIKFGIEHLSMNKSQWKFARMRPSSFPNKRLVLIADFLSEHPAIYRSIIEQKSLKIIGLGSASTDSLNINLVAVLMYAHGLREDDASFLEGAIEYLHALKPEKNRIVDLLTKEGFEVKNAAESQGAIELYTEKCLNKKCFECAVGVKLLS